MEMIFTRIRKNLQMFRDWQQWRKGSKAAAEPDELHRGVGSRDAARGVAKGPTILPSAMQVVVSLVVLAVGFYIILSNMYDSETQKWAFGVVGIVVGFWLS